MLGVARRVREAVTLGGTGYPWKLGSFMPPACTHAPGMHPCPQRVSWVAERTWGVDLRDLVPIYVSPWKGDNNVP